MLSEFAVDVSPASVPLGPRHGRRDEHGRDGPRPHARGRSDDRDHGGRYQRHAGPRRARRWHLHAAVQHRRPPGVGHGDDAHRDRRWRRRPARRRERRRRPPPTIPTGLRWTRPWTPRSRPSRPRPRASATRSSCPTVLADGTKRVRPHRRHHRLGGRARQDRRGLDLQRHGARTEHPRRGRRPGADRAAQRAARAAPTSTSTGSRVPNVQDGVAPLTQPTGRARARRFTYEFTRRRSRRSGMYHAHAHAEHSVPNGMFGAFIVGEMPLPARRHVPAGTTIEPGDPDGAQRRRRDRARR